MVYQVPCKDCRKVYIGETKRTLKMRISEHKQAIRKGDEKNGIAVHAHITNHNVDWEGTRVHGTVRGFWKRRMMEAIQIHAEPHTMKLDCGLPLSPAWYPVINSGTRPQLHLLNFDGSPPPPKSIFISLTYSLSCTFSVIYNLTHQHVLSHHQPLYLKCLAL